MNEEIKLPGLPPGVVAVRWGVPMPDDHVMMFDGSIVQAEGGCDQAFRLIVKRTGPPFIVPANAIADGWIACDADGDTWWFEREPRLLVDRWVGSKRCFLCPLCLPWLRWPADLPWTERIVRVPQ